MLSCEVKSYPPSLQFLQAVVAKLPVANKSVNYWIEHRYWCAVLCVCVQCDLFPPLQRCDGAFCPSPHPPPLVFNHQPLPPPSQCLHDLAKTGCRAGEWRAHPARVLDRESCPSPPLPSPRHPQQLPSVWGAYPGGRRGAPP